MEHYRLEWQSARDCAAPLSHCLLLPEKEEGGEGKKRGGKKRLTAKNKSDTLKFPSFLLFTIKIFFFSAWKLRDFRGDLSSSTCGLGIRTSLSYA